MQLILKKASKRDAASWKDEDWESSRPPTDLANNNQVCPQLRTSRCTISVAL